MVGYGRISSFAHDASFLGGHDFQFADGYTGTLSQIYALLYNL